MPSVMRLYAIGTASGSSCPKVASSLKNQLHSLESQSTAHSCETQSRQGAQSLAAAYTTKLLHLQLE